MVPHASLPFLTVANATPRVVVADCLAFMYRGELCLAKARMSSMVTQRGCRILLDIFADAPGKKPRFRISDMFPAWLSVHCFSCSVALRRVCVLRRSTSRKHAGPPTSISAASRLVLGILWLRWTTLRLEGPCHFLRLALGIFWLLTCRLP